MVESPASSSPRRGETRRGRPYRSKRHPPCDQCRRKKLRCDTNGLSACQRCLVSKASCSFGPGSRQRGAADQALAEDDIHIQNQEQAENPSRLLSPDLNPFLPDDSFSAALATYPLPEKQHAQQAIQTLDLLQGVSSQVIGASGESDPWLLRHGRFDDYGFLLSNRVHFRNAGGVPLNEKIPVHFLVTEDELYTGARARGLDERSKVGDEVHHLVPVELGRRLVGLFIRHIFPSLPLVSRTRLGLAANQLIPDVEAVQNTPANLLAALYASALPLSHLDDQLCLAYAYSAPPTSRLWQIVYELLLDQIHTPHLAILQAGILYLHRPAHGPEAALADSPSLWSLVGLLVGLAMSLGLQLECRPMGLPAWEQRLRRRLWWAIYSEDKWRSLLMGRPPYIRQDEWDVTELDDADFFIDQAEARSADDCHFTYFVRLSWVAEDVQHRLYSLRAAQRLSCRFHESVHVARTLLQKLKDWHHHLPASLRLQTRPPTVVGTRKTGSPCLHFCYILLEVYIFRALLRPMVRSSTPPRLLDESELSPSIANPVDDFFAQVFGAEDVEPTLAINMADENGPGYAVLRAAENCATTALRFVMRLSTREMADFWYNWCRIGFATVSSLVLLLLVQAPTKEHALRARRLLDMWRQTLQTQSRGCEMMRLALVRLNAVQGSGLARTFHLPGHVRDALSVDMDMEQVS